MRAARDFFENARNLVKKTMVYGGLAFGAAGFSAEDASAQRGFESDNSNNRWKYYAGLKHVTGTPYNPFETGKAIVVGANVPLLDDEDSPLGQVLGLRGEYSYYLADPNQITFSGQYRSWNQNGQYHYSHIPSRAMLAVTLNTPEKYRLKAQAYGGLLAYPGNWINWANWAHPVIGAEASFKARNNRRLLNFEVFGAVKHILYNKHFMDRFTPDGSNSTSTEAGFRVTFAPR